MFTGLVQGLGRVRQYRAQGGEAFLDIALEFSATDIAKGESISVNGVCLTVETPLKDGFRAYASLETATRSTLGKLKQGQKVNIERALRLSDRFGGHLVSGHVDAVISILGMASVGSSQVITFSLPPELADQVAAKGSVALDGVSLTVNDCGPDKFTVNVIPETLSATIAAQWQVGDAVNLETDVLAKYIARQLEMNLSKDNVSGAGLGMEFFREHGF